MNYQKMITFNKETPIDPHILIGAPIFSLKTSRFLSKTPIFSLETPIYQLEKSRFLLETLIFSLEISRFLLENPRLSLETHILCWLPPYGGFERKSRVLNENLGVSYKNLGVYEHLYRTMKKHNSCHKLLNKIQNDISCSLAMYISISE